MSTTRTARRTDIRIAVNGADISADMKKYLLSVSFTDEEEDKSDDISIQIDDRDGEWLHYWLNSDIKSGAAGNISTGDKVTVKQGAADYNGVQLHSWVYSYEGFSVLEISPNNPNRVVIGIGGVVTAAMRADDLTVISSGSGAASDSSSGKPNGLKGASVAVGIIQDDNGSKKLLDCGIFEIDTIKANGPPSRITIKGTSLPVSSTVRTTKRNRAWENITLSALVRQIALTNGLKCEFYSDLDPMYERQEQVDESDIVLLQRLCKAAGLCLKCTANTIVLFDEAEFEKRSPAFSIVKGGSNILNWSFSDGSSDTAYSSCHVSYTNEQGKTIEYTYTPRIDNPGTGQVLEINEKVTSREEARQLAMKRLRQKNKNQFAASFTMIGDCNAVASVTVDVSGFGSFDGKYIIERAVHSVSGGGYTTSIELHRVLEEY